MTQKTDNLIKELTTMLLEQRAVIIVGNSGSGKTFLAKAVSERLKEKEFNFFSKFCNGQVAVEILSCQSHISYNDIVGGITPDIVDGKMEYNYQDSILIEMLLAASNDYFDKVDKKYVLILDDIQKIELSTVIGEAIEAIGKTFSGDDCSEVLLNSGKRITVPPNFYLIATYNGQESRAIPVNLGFMKRCYMKEVLSDITYVTDDASSSSTIWYENIKQIMFDYLDIQFKTTTYEQNRYMLGHGMFVEPGLNYRIKYQVIPFLKQYVKEGILKPEASSRIVSLEADCDTIPRSTCNNTSDRVFSKYKENVSPQLFVENGEGSNSIINLVGRIISQGVLCAEDIENQILFNPNVCYREKEVQGITYRATIVASENSYYNMRRDRGDRRSYYNGGEICIRDKKFYFTGGVQQTEYTLRPQKKIGETTAPNVFLSRIIEFYYKTIIGNLKKYGGLEAVRDDKSTFLKFAKMEWEKFDDNYHKIRPRRNAEERTANLQLRELIADLTLLWSELGSVIEVGDGKKFTVERLEHAMSNNQYKEYSDAMKALGINQMILQGPPGTSKTYSAKEYIKFKAGISGNGELDELQITNYDTKKDKNFCKKMKEGNITPGVVWDIVQFHPSYGYEDFIRGIEVSTDTENNIVYKTINRILGNIAKLASDNPQTDFYLIIDEINRANLATVFGELIYGLEYRDEEVATPYKVDNSNKIKLPVNLYIIGTMNTADKSIGGIDYAIRRRFLFFEQLPDQNVIKEYKLEAGGEDQSLLNEKACKLFENIGSLFSEAYLSPEYRKEDVQLGHTYFLVDAAEKDGNDKLKMRFKYQMVPILKEYYKDGILSFESGVYNDNSAGFEGLLCCVSGQIDITSDKIEKIFDKLIA